MNIGEAAAASGVSAKMIRYYEATGLLRAPPRSEGGYRVYDAAGVHTLRFIRRARDFGFPMPVIRQLVGLWQDPGRESHDVKELALAQVAELRRRIGELQAMEAALAHLAASCHGDARAECPILEDLAMPRAGDREAPSPAGRNSGSCHAHPAPASASRRRPASRAARN